jgi:hypothetical protein
MTVDRSGSMAVRIAEATRTSTPAESRQDGQRRALRGGPPSPGRAHRRSRRRCWCRPGPAPPASSTRTWPAPQWRLPAAILPPESLRLAAADLGRGQARDRLGREAQGEAKRLRRATARGGRLAAVFLAIGHRPRLDRAPPAGCRRAGAPVQKLTETTCAEPPRDRFRRLQAAWHGPEDPGFIGPSDRWRPATMVRDRTKSSTPSWPTARASSPISDAARPPSTVRAGDVADRSGGRRPDAAAPDQAPARSGPMRGEPRGPYGNRTDSTRMDRPETGFDASRRSGAPRKPLILLI